MGASVEEIRNEVVFSALEALALHMGSLKEGRQTLVLVSEGFVSSNRDKLYSNLRGVAETASRYNTAIYPVSPLILAPNGQWMPNNSMETLNFLALHSGGRAIFDQTRTGAEYRERTATVGLPRSQLTLAMKQMVVDASVFYLMGYDSTTAPDDKFHKIEVKVKRRGVEVRHREGYWARKQ
jgi:VWFA-related protein